MHAIDTAVGILECQPFRSVLLWLGKVDLGRALLNRLSLYRGSFEDFEQAWFVARKVRHAGHEHPDAITSHFALSKTLRASDYAVLYWLLRVATQYHGALDVLDFGGNAGNLYYAYSQYLKQMVPEVRWTVFDLPEVIKAGQRIAAERGATNLKFIGALSDLAATNVLLVSGALHYWEGTVRSFFEQFSQLPKHVILNRTPIHKAEPSFITVQRTKSYAVPCIVRNQGELLSAFESMGYAKRDEWPSLELRLRMPLFPNLTVPHYSGFYFSLL